MPKTQKRENTSMPILSCLELNAAGVDVGATEIYIAVPADRAPQSVRRFSTFREDLHAAADVISPIAKPASALIRLNGY